MPELNITEDEAAMLAAVLAYVGGSPTNSPREHERSLYRKLNDLGYSFTRGRAKEFHALIKGEGGKYAGMRFDDFPEPFVPGYYRDNTDGEVLYHAEEPNLRYWTRVKVTDNETGDEYTSAE